MHGIITSWGLPSTGWGSSPRPSKTWETSNARNWDGINGAKYALNWLVLAMCHHQLGHSTQAETSFEKATTLIQAAIPKPGEPTQMPTPDWIEWHVLQPQAKELLNISADDLDPSASVDSS